MTAPEDATVVVLGAGPVGLYVAHRLTLNNVAVHLYEKRKGKDDAMRRKYILYINERVYRLFSEGERGPFFGVDRAPWQVKRGEFLRGRADNSTPAAICSMQDLQKMLWRKIQDNPGGFSATFDAGSQTMADIKAAHPRVKHIVHATGSGPLALTDMEALLPVAISNLFPGNSDYGMTLAFGQTRSERFDYTQHVNPDIGMQTRFFTLPPSKVYMGLQLTPAMHSELQRNLAIFKNKNSDEYKERLRALAAGLLLTAEGAEKYLTAANVTSGGLQPGLFEIRLQERRTAVRKFNDVNHHFVGDAAQTAHFFTGQGVNVGLLQADNVTQRILRKISKQTYKKTFDKLQAINRAAFRRFRGI